MRDFWSGFADTRYDAGTSALGARCGLLIGGMTEPQIEISKLTIGDPSCLIVYRIPHIVKNVGTTTRNVHGTR